MHVSSARAGGATSIIADPRATAIRNGLNFVNIPAPRFSTKFNFIGGIVIENTYGLE
jgi:hypothetical protein